MQKVADSRRSRGSPKGRRGRGALSALHGRPRPGRAGGVRALRRRRPWSTVRAGRWLAASLGLAACAAAADAQDSDWRLQITGHTSYFFGEPGYGGGLRIPWEVVIGFQIRDGEYHLGSGTARWLDEVVPLSYPPNWFSCRQVEGTYLDSNLTLHETPRLRFVAFPVAGEVSGGRVRLAPAYRPPGNYLAVTYQCTSDNPLAYNWFAVAERGKQVLGKRQDAEKHAQGAEQRVRVREVAAIPPEAGIELPLEDGWAFSQGAADDAHTVRYRLTRGP